MSRTDPVPDSIRRPPGVLRRIAGRARGPGMGRRGVAVLEFALLAPALALLMLASTDVVVWMKTWLQMEETSSQVANIASQYYNLYTSDFTGTFFPVAQNIARAGTLTCSSSSPGNIIISGITTTSGKPVVTWQMAQGSCTTSLFGKAGNTATLPGGYIPPNGIGIITVEVSTTASAFVLSAKLITGTGAPTTINSYAIVAMRNGVLPVVTTGTRPS